jgi:O-antigen ligase
VGLVAGLAGAVVLRRRHALPFLRQALSTAAFGALAYVILLVVIPEMTGNATLDTIQVTVDRTMSDPTSSRTVLWRCALGLIAQHPWLGVGPMHFAHEAWRICTGAHPHDWVLQIAAEWGLPALLCLVFVLATGARGLIARARAVPHEDAPGQAVATALLVAMIAILVDGLVSGVIVMPQSQLAIAFYVGCAMGWCRAPALHAPSASGPLRLWRGAIVLAAAAALLAGAGPGALAIMRDIPPTDAQMVNQGNHWPRLWQLGYF